MRFFIDFEFIEDGRTIDPISVGIVREDGKEYYAEFAECDLSRASDWVKENVFPHLTGERKPRPRIAQEIREFVGDSWPEFWAYFGAYDWIALCQLYGRMIDLPPNWPMFYWDIAQSAASLGNVRLPPPLLPEHHALVDARWARDAWRWLETARETRARVSNVTNGLRNGANA